MPDGPRHVAQHLTTPSGPNATTMAGKSPSCGGAASETLRVPGCLPILSAYSLADTCRDEWYPAAPEEPK